MNGMISIDILDAASGIILKHYDPKPNLILNVGKDKPFSYFFEKCFLYGHLSTDTTTPSATDTTMAGWVKQTNTYGDGDGATSFTGDVFTLTRAFVFTAETGDVTYTKFYSSPTSGSGASPFNEILFGTPITLSSGQQAKVTMSLLVTITPHTTAATYGSDVISGVLGSTGSARIPFFGQSIFGRSFFLGGIQSSGASLSSTYGAILEPSSIAAPYSTAQRTYVSASMTSLLDAGTYQTSSYTITYSSTYQTLSTYTAGTYTRYKIGFCDLAECNVSSIKSVGTVYAGNGTGSLRDIGYQFVSDTAFTKLNTQQLTMHFTYTVS